MMRISYSRMFWGTTLISAAPWVVVFAVLLLLRILGEDWNAEDKEAVLGSIGFVILSFFNGLLVMLVLKIFGKKEEPTASVKEEPKEKIVYVIKEEPKERKENKEDDTRYMPR